jgi:ADP-heptose:LPS heptosyltransferase
MQYIFVNPKIRILVKLIDKIFFCIFSLKKRKKKFSFEKINKILLIRLDQIGDVLLTTPAVSTIRKAFPKQAKIYYLLSERTKDIIEQNPNVDELITYQACWFWKNTKFNLKEFIRLIKRIRKEEFDLGIDFRGDFRNILIMWLGKVRYKVSYGITGGGFLLDLLVEYKTNNIRWIKHEVDRNLDLVKALGINQKKADINKNLSLYLRDEDIEFADKFFKEKDIKKEDKIIGIHPGSLRPAKQWNPAKFARLINKLIEEKFKVILFSGPNDKDTIEKIRKNTRFEPIIAPQVNLKKFAALLKKINLLVCVNSAALHIGSALGIKKVVIFSACDSKTAWGPIDEENSIVIQKDVPCKYCGMFDCKNHICMDLISEEEVFAAIIKLIKPVSYF